MNQSTSSGLHDEAFSSENRPVAMQHSRLGIASFALSLTCLVALLCVSIFANQSRPESPGIIIAAILYGVVFLSLISVLMGAYSLFQTDRKKLFGILGIVVGAGPILLLG